MTKQQIVKHVLLFLAVVVMTVILQQITLAELNRQTLLSVNGKASLTVRDTLQFLNYVYMAIPVLYLVTVFFDDITDLVKKWCGIDQPTDDPDLSEDIRNEEENNNVP